MIHCSCWHKKALNLFFFFLCQYNHMLTYAHENLFLKFLLPVFFFFLLPSSLILNCKSTLLSRCTIEKDKVLIKQKIFVQYLWKEWQ